jgi:hypothetical protein
LSRLQHCHTSLRSQKGKNAVYFINSSCISNYFSCVLSDSFEVVATQALLRKRRKWKIKIHFSHEIALSLRTNKNKLIGQSQKLSSGFKCIIAANELTSEDGKTPRFFCNFFLFHLVTTVSSPTILSVKELRSSRPQSASWP